MINTCEMHNGHLCFYNQKTNQGYTRLETNTSIFKPKLSYCFLSTYTTKTKSDFRTFDTENRKIGAKFLLDENYAINRFL